MLVEQFNTCCGSQSSTKTFQVLDALDFHLPQRRRRLWLVGYKKQLASSASLNMLLGIAHTLNP